MTTYSDPNGGLPFTTQKLEPEHVNSIVANSRSAWLNAAANRRVTRIPNVAAGTSGSIISDLTTSVYWSPVAKRFLFGNGAAKASVIGADGLVSFLITGFGYPSLTEQSYPGAYEVSGEYRIEVWGSEATEGSAYRTSFPVLRESPKFSNNISTWTWTTLTCPAFAARGAPVWMGGPNNVRLVPGRTANDGAHDGYLYYPGLGTPVWAPIGGNGESPYSSRATNGSGVLVSVGYGETSSVVSVWRGSAYGSPGNWSSSTIQVPSPTETVGFPGVGYDSARGVFVVVTKAVTTVNSVQTGRAIYTTSSDGITWQPWRAIQVQDSGLELCCNVACVSGAWIVCATARDLDGLTHDWMHISVDGGASWSSVEAFTPSETENGSGQPYAHPAGSITQVIACGGRVVRLLKGNASGSALYLTTIGPVDSPAETASVAI